MKIGELASATGLSRDTLRFYEKRGLLLPRRRDNGYRDYAPEASAQALREALRGKLADIDARIAALGQLRAALARELSAPGEACPLRA
jgi:MerR family copper efflux transcriptional regulator